MKPPSWSLTRRLLAGLLFGFIVLLGLALLGDIRQVSGRLAGFRWSYYPLVLGFTLFNYSLRFLKWHYYLRQVGVRGLPWQHSARLFVAGFPLAITPGKLGEALKAVWLNRATGLALARGVSVVVAERISDGLAVMVLSTLGVIAYPRYWPAFAFILVILGSVVIVSQIRPLALAILRLSERLPLLNRFSHPLREFYEASYVLFRPQSALVGIGLGSISWLGEGIGMYFILLGLGVPAGWNALSIAIFTLSFSIVIGAASALPAGLGASELSIVGMLAILLGLSADLSAAATLLIRFATLWFGTSLGLLVWLTNRQLFSLENHHPPAPQDGEPGAG